MPSPSTATTGGPTSGRSWTRLRTALGEDAAGELPARWLPVDPELTQPGNRPSLVPEQDDLPPPSAPKRRRWPAAALAGALLVVGAVGGYVAWQQTHQDVTLEDSRGVLSVTVPTDWSRAVSEQGWTPSDSSIVEPGLSTGDAPDWASASDGQGVFAGLLPENQLPEDHASARGLPQRRQGRAQHQRRAVR